MFYDITQRKQLEQKQEQLIDELQEALSQAKQLSGLLPICAGCKKIRDEKNEWHHLETYIRARSEAEFTHGICPECLDEVYKQE